MIDLDAALRAAEAFIADLNRGGGEPVALMPAQTRTLPYGWVFFYQSRAYIASGDPRDLVAGNAPLLVTRGGESHVLGTACPLEEYLRAFERSGSPHPPSAPGGVQVRITGGRAGMQRVRMLRTIRDRTGVGLKAAKAITNAVLGGRTVAVPARDWAAAVELVEALQALGAEARAGEAPSAADPDSTADREPR